MFKISLKLLKYVYIRCLSYMFQPHTAIFKQHIFLKESAILFIIYIYIYIF
jgi:hypothetical protein